MSYRNPNRKIYSNYEALSNNFARSFSMMQRSFATIGQAKANSRLTAYKQQAAMYERMRKQNEKDNDDFAKFLEGTGFKDLQGVSSEVNEAIKAAYNNNKLKFDEFRLLNTEKRQQNKDDITNLSNNIQILQKAVSLNPNTRNPHADPDVVNLVQLLIDKSQGKEADLKISGAQDKMDLMFTFGHDDPATPENERKTMSLSDFREKVGTYTDITAEVNELEEAYKEEKAEIIKAITAEANRGKDNSAAAIAAGIESFMENDGSVKVMYDYNISPFSGPVRINNKGELDSTSKEALNVPMRYDHRSNARIKELNPGITDEEIDIIRKYQRDQVQNVISKRLGDELTDITLKIKEDSNSATLRIDERLSFAGTDEAIRKGITKLNAKESSMYKDAGDEVFELGGYDTTDPESREDKVKAIIKLADHHRLGGKNLQTIYLTKSEIFEKWKDIFKEKSQGFDSNEALALGINYQKWWQKNISGGSTRKTGEALEKAWTEFFNTAAAQEAFINDIGKGDIYLPDGDTYVPGRLNVDSTVSIYRFILGEQDYITKQNLDYFRNQFNLGSEEYRSGN